MARSLKRGVLAALILLAITIFGAVFITQARLKARGEAHKARLSEAAKAHEALLSRVDDELSEKISLAERARAREELERSRLEELEKRARGTEDYREYAILSARWDEAKEAVAEANIRIANNQLDCVRMGMWPRDDYTLRVFIEMTGMELWRSYKRYLSLDPDRIQGMAYEYRQAALCLAVLIRRDARARSIKIRQRAPMRDLVELRESARIAGTLVEAVDERLSEVRLETAREIAASEAAFKKIHIECLDAMPPHYQPIYCVPLAYTRRDAPPEAEPPGVEEEEITSDEKKLEAIAVEASSGQSGDLVAAAQRATEKPPRVIAELPPLAHTTLYSEIDARHAEFEFAPREDIPLQLSARDPSKTHDGKLKLIASRRGEPAAILASFECLSFGCSLDVAARDDQRLVAWFSYAPAGRDDGATRAILFEWDEERDGLIAIESVRTHSIDDSDLPHWAKWSER